jgi:uncharacterized membrane protein YedE/YeeE
MATEFTLLASFAGGALIGLSAVGLLLVSGRIAGITGIIRRAMLPSATSQPMQAVAFIVGLVTAPLVWRAVTGTWVVQIVSNNLPLLVVAGLLVGFGSTLGSGCTSGHGVCGLSRFSPRSFAATLTFMATAIATVYVSRHVLGG